MTEEKKIEDFQLQENKEDKKNDFQPPNLEEKIKILEEKIEKLEKEKEEYLDGWRRAKADLINYKKDEAKRFEEVTKFSLSLLMTELIEVLDSFDLGLAMMKEDEGSKKGLILLRSKLFETLKKFGLEQIPSPVNQPFTPLEHEAVMEVEGNDLPEGIVIEELARGYKLNGRVIRPSRVKVVKKKEEDNK